MAAASPPAATTPEPDVDAVLYESLDLRELAESSSSSGSYWLRWELFFESARRRDAVP
jgi:hypothetical protein